MDENHQDKTGNKATAVKDATWVFNRKSKLRGPTHKKSGWLRSGFKDKTAWELLQLFIQLLAAVALPVVLFLAVQGFSAQQSQASQQIAADQQRETTLKTYLDDISDLLLNHNLRKSKPMDEVSQVARERTLTALRRLDANRNNIVLRFLQDAHLIGVKDAVINLSTADLSNDDLGSVNLSNTDLSYAYLISADMSRADLFEANLSGALLVNAELDKAYLRGANLRGAHLYNANLRGADLSADLRDADLIKNDHPRADQSAAIEVQVRADQSGIIPGADLSGALLSDADLEGANLSGALLGRADLEGAHLSEALLGGTLLSGADLEGADLSYAHLYSADLRGANLKGATGITLEELEKEAKNLKGAIMPDGSKHP